MAQSFMGTLLSDDQPQVAAGRVAVVIPVYNHCQFVRGVVTGVMKTGLPVIVVDDGSTDSTADELKDITGIKVVRHARNQGKGAAIMTGFRQAVKKADWALTIDADGQHDPEDIPAMIQSIPETRAIVVGKRVGMTHQDVPWTSQFGRKFSNFWVRVSGGPAISDSQSGFRIYPIPECLQLNIASRRYQFEVEILVKAARQNIPIVETPVSVRYNKKQRVSHFRPFIDFVRNSITFSRLIFQRLVR